VVSFFCFQAEDGIRDWSVTGVQTCALPICGTIARKTSPFAAPRPRSQSAAFISRLPAGFRRSSASAPPPQATRTDCAVASRMVRSEERRVGEEGRSVWAGQGLEEKENAVRD